MKEAIGVDTEGLYIGEREPLVMVNDGKLEQAKQDIIFIRENLLHKIWFYYENGQHFIPNEITAGQKSIMFYAPSHLNPYIRKSTQYIYIVKFSNHHKSPGLTSVTSINGWLRPPILAQDDF